jgi:hypothetical protein
MDYPKSVPNVGLVDGKFIDENTVTGAVGSLIPSAWGNAVTDEILAVIKAAGIVPAEGANDQLLKAIRGSSLFSTQPQFTVSKDVATTEFVQRALGNRAGAAIANSAAALTASIFGKLLLLNSGTSFNVTLPPSSIGLVGSTIYVQNVGSAAATLVAAAGDSLGAIATQPMASLVVQPGSSVELVLQGTNYFISGAAALKYSPEFSFSAGSNGYQKYPSGLIEQWGSVAVSDNAEANVVLPTAFPNAIFGAVVSVPLSAQAGAAEFSIAGVRKNGSSLNSILVNANSGPTSSVNPVIFWRVWGN